MGCDTAYKTRRGINTSFNPRTRMGCDKGIAFPALGLSVSIHAPAWGATTYVRYFLTQQRFQSTHPHGVRPPLSIESLMLFMFQSTHPHGVRLDEDEEALAERLFQSTHPHGVRLLALAMQGLTDAVSIHAPAWGATTRWSHSHTSVPSFNPRTRMGCDLAWMCFRSMLCSFNPRTRMGCDSILSNELNIIVQIYRICE